MTTGSTRGFTLVELLVSCAILAILALSVPPLFHLSQVGLTDRDARALMKQQSQDAARRIAGNLREARRVYCRQVTAYNSYPTPPDIADFFSSTISLSGFPPPLAGTRLPLQKELLIIDAETGNALFFAKQLPSTDILLTSGQIVRIDLYRFYYYYVAFNPEVAPIADRATRQLYEWTSVVYADFSQINQIVDAGDQAQTILALRSQNILYAYNISLVTFTNAFYNLEPSGLMVQDTAPMIRASQVLPVTRSSGGRVFSNFRLGISPNTTDLSIPTSILVPHSTTGGWTTPSPSGFEILIPGSGSVSGQRGNSLYSIRLVLAVSGPIGKPFLLHEDGVSVNVRDVW